MFKKKQSFYMLLILPALFFYMLALVGPLLFGTVPSAFFEWNNLKVRKNFVGFAIFIKLLNDDNFIKSTLFTVKLALSASSHAFGIKAPTFLWMLLFVILNT